MNHLAWKGPCSIIYSYSGTQDCAIFVLSFHILQSKQGCSDASDDLDWGGEWEMGNENCRRGGWRRAEVS